MDQVKTTHGSIDSLSHLSQCSSPRMEALSEDQFSLKSEDSRVKFLCSYGGRIMPRPHDCQLRYAGGETRLLVVSRNITLADLMAKLTRLCGKSVLALKFQLPNEDLDSLVSVLCEEDLENMMEEYDRLESRDASVRLRLFLFPAKSHSVSLDFHEYDSRNAEQRFVDAVNGNFSRRQNSMPTSQGLPDFLFGLDIFEKQARLPGALPKASSQPLPCTRSYHEGVLEKDQLSLLNSPPILQPLVNSQQEAASKQHPTILLDSEIPISNPPTISVADHSLEDLEVIKQLSSLIPTPLELQVSEKKPSLDMLGSCDEEKNWKRNFQTKPELDLARELNLSPTLDDPHKPTKRGLSTSSAPIDDNQRKDPLSVRVRAEINSPLESPAEGGGIKGSNSSTYNQHLPKVLHGLPVLSDKPDYFPADLNSNVQRTKSVSNQVNGDVSTLGGQKPEPRTEFARNQQHSSDKQGGDGDQKDQKEGERPSEDHTESLTSHGKAKRYPFLNAEGQQEINDKASRHIREAYKFEDTEIPLKSTVAQHSNQQHVVQPHVIASNNTHANQWQKEDQIRQHIDGGAVQLPHTSAFPQQTGPSHFPPPTILRVTSASTPPSRAYDLPRSAHRQCMAAPQPAHLHRQLTAAMTYSELQQQPSPLPKIKVGQPTTRDQTVPRATRVQSPSRFRDMPPSTPFQVQWVNSEERMLMRSVHHLSGGTMLHSIQQDHYVDPNGHLLCDPSITQSQYYADHVNTSELTPFNIPHNDELGHSNDQPLDSHAYQGGVGLAHHAREPQAGSAEGHRHVIHQVMRT